MPRLKNDGKGRIAGRGKGVVNKRTKDVREAIAQLAQANIEHVQRWLNEIAATDPAKAMDLYLKMIEYHVPKLARTEVTGKDGKDFDQTIRVEVVHSRPKNKELTADESPN
jgi:hypothetical protein